MPEFANVRSMTIGDTKITYLNDGGGIVKPTVTYPTSDEAGWETYNRFLDDNGDLIVSIGGFLIEKGDRKIIMDTGFGPMTIEFPGFGPFIGGKYMESFAKTGVAREDITDVVYTHLHLDHCGWTTVVEDGQRVLSFPNARHVCTEAEWDFWDGDESGLGPNPELAQNALRDIVQFIKADDEIAPGITVLDTAGHTPGHISLKIDTGAETVYMIADLLHSEVQFYKPEWCVAFDADQAQARATREGILDTLAQSDVIVADGHFADRVFGRLVKDGDSYQWQAVQ
ncbi:MAG: MBL fold metallo-hydrolase [Anaerolineales bacterium]|nr:MBL fold metallo-hydrolase [Anaerolineales bacterium]